jgi:hypothetical protein
VSRHSLCWMTHITGHSHPIAPYKNLTERSPHLYIPKRLLELLQVPPCRNTGSIDFGARKGDVVSNTFDATLLLMIPLGAVLVFCFFALWGFSKELRTGRRRRVSRTAYYPRVLIYAPPQQVLRFRRSHDREAA